ncbi:uncharacterized protein arhgef5 isoform X2 [Nelusetta ayraudi]|uniref:uncharacterized protein arhgef5 isoform X2 n=1 Tax=Nelusetta ayraudi TaxID=303726 RepID=UPI003F7271FB
MGTKRPSCTLFDTSSNINTADRKLQPGGNVSRDPSPRPALTALLERERDGGREDNWRRGREAEKMRDKARPKDVDPRDRYYDRERAPVPRPREGDRGRREREWREEDIHSRNGRPLSSVEKEAEREVGWGMRKGDTFPRIRKNSRERGGRGTPAGGEMDDERGERRQRDRQRWEEMDAREREWARQRERERERERDEARSPRPKDDRQNAGRRYAEEEKGRERYKERDTGDARDRKDRDATRKRDKPRPDMGHREGRVPSPRRRRDWEEDERRRRERRRDTRSEGDSDEREVRRDKERERQREEQQYQNSRSEGDKRKSAQREREEEEDRLRHRERCRAREEDKSKRWEEEKKRERGEPRPPPREADRDTREDWRRQQRYRDLQEGGKVREVEPGPDNPASRGRMRAASERAPSLPPRAQSSGEWSTTESDRDVEEQRATGERRQREKKRSERAEGERGERGERGEVAAGGKQEQRRMWLEPRWGENSREDRGERRTKSESREEAEKERPRARDEGSSGEGVRADRERGADMDEDQGARLSSSDGGVEESDGEEAAGSGGGSETGGWRREGDRLLSGEEGFVTVSSGGDDEEQFQDCREEFWDGGEEEAGDRSKASKYVFCVIGQSLPRSATEGESPSGSAKGAEAENPYDEVTWEPPQDEHGPPAPPRRNLKYPAVNSRDSKSSCDVSDEGGEPRDAEGTMRREKENPYAEIGPINRDSQTERLLTQWRNRGDGEGQSDLPANPYGDCFPGLDFEQLQPILDGIDSGTMSPEEVEAIRIRLSGAWSISQEPKRHSQAPHLKWAKNVVREILGHSEDQQAPAETQEEVAEEGEEEAPGGSRAQQEEIHREAGEPPVDELRVDEGMEVELEELDVEEVVELAEEEEEEEGSRDDEDDRSKSWGEVELRNVLDTMDRRKRNSKFFNAAQLYQQYSEAAQNFEILRQARSDAVSLAGETAPSPAPSPPPARRPLPPVPASFHHHQQPPQSLSYTGSVTSVQSLPLPAPPRSGGRPSSPRLSMSLGQSSSLWRELPGVRNSSELEELSEDERRLQEVRFEVVTSEASYCRSLDIVVEHFVKSKQLGALLTTQDRNWLFSRLADVRAISHSFLSKLEERVESNIMSFTVCDIIARHCQRFRMVYVPYLTNQSYQDATYQRLMNENPGFKRIVEKLERSPVCQRLPFRSFLVLPFQRITRIKLLVQNIVKRTTPGTPEATYAIKSLKLVEKLIQEGNDSITQMKSIESLVSLSAKVDFECRTLPLISQSRRLVREGLVTELIDFSLKDTERNIYLHLFNDYLLMSLQKEGGRFTVIDHSPVSDLRVENCRVKLHSLQKNLFRLHMAHKALLLRTDTQSDKLRWISSLSRPHPEIDFSAAQDFPQMQCVRSCVAQQPDELSLEKADIILVHQQSSDHWVEGTRLSDRHRGWVPESHLETISNSKVRNRNLSDAQKLTTATAAV